jgi:hypothetical protein
VTTDATGNNLNVPGTVAAGNAVEGPGGVLTTSIWQKQGQLFASSGEPSVLFESNAQLLAVPSTTNVFKAWYDGCGGTCYAESLTGLVGSWTVQGTPAATLYERTCIRHYGSTYYFFGVLIAGSNTHIDLLTSTTGTSFTLSTSNLITTGSGGAWDSLTVSTGTVFYDGTTYRMLYQGQSATTPWQTGYATASSITGPWTKSGSNPVITTAIGPGGMAAGGTSNYIDGSGNIWVWEHSSPASGSTAPTDIYRYESSDWVHWTRTPLNPVLRRTTAIEGVGSPQGQIADPALVEANGSVYMFYSTVQTQGTGPYGVSLAIAPMTFTHLVATDEGATQGYSQPAWGNTNDILVASPNGAPVDSGVSVTNTATGSSNLITFSNTPYNWGATGNIYAAGLSGHIYRGYGYPYFTRIGTNQTTGNQSYFSVNYDYAAGTVDFAEVSTASILADANAGTICLATGGANTAPTCKLTVAYNGITNTPVFQAGATFSGSTPINFNSPFRVNGWTKTFSETTMQVADTPGNQAFGIATLSSGTITVSNSAACTPSATCVYKLTNCSLNGSAVVGVPSVGTVSVGTSFVINSLTALAAVSTDTSKICWQIN